MKIIFATDNKPWSFLIRWFTWSRYSHVAIVNRQKVIEATLLHGVRVAPLQEFLDKYKENILICDVPKANVKKAWAFATQQLNKPYDLKAVFGLVFRKRWTDDKKWFCSELATVALYNGGATIIRKEAYRVTPEDLLNSPLVKPIEKKKEKIE